MAHILAVDDDRDLCTLLKTALERDGHTVETRTSGTQLTDTLCRWADCILLDVMMPGEDGFAVCRRIRAETDAPILFLTARTDEPSVLTGLGIGADDYLTKPFRVAELRARVAAHLRRQNRTPSHKITRGGVTLDLSAKEAGVDGMPLHLTKSEYAICELLALHAGQTFSKEQIYEAVFGYDGTADDTAITQHIKNIRAKLRVAGAGELILVLWWIIFMQLINIGFLLPAVASAQACADARETVASMTADTFDSLQISDLCRWAVVQNDTVLQTNMDDRHLKIALNAFHGGSGNPGYQYDVKMADGSFCLLQYDYATPYADPALRDTLPDFQTCYILLLAVLILVWLGWQTHCTVRVFAAETARLHRAVDAIAAQQPERIDADGAHLREFSATLHAMQTMGRELTNSLQSQWRMEQQRAEQIAALTHDLKTPLSIIQGNADLLAEDALSADQQTQVEAILRGTDRAQQYLAALRTACAPPATGETFPSHTLVSELAETARALCTPAGVQLILNEQWQGTLCAAQCDLLRAAENLLDNAVRYTPRGGTVTLLVTKEKQDFILRVTDTGPGFTAEALARAGELLYTEAARSDTAHQGFGLYFARRVALSHSGTLRLSNTPGGCAELRLPICEQIEK